MVAHCRHQFWLDRADPDDKTEGKPARRALITDALVHSVVGSFANRVQVRMLRVPPRPAAAGRIWEIWQKVSHMRARYDGGFGPLDVGSVDTYLDRTGVVAGSWDWDALLLIDGCWLASFTDVRTYPFEDDPEAEFDATR